MLQNVINFYFLFFTFRSRVKLELETTLLRLKEKKDNSTPLLPISVAPLQQLRWCWILRRTFYTSQTKINLNLTQIQWWIWEEQLIEIKIQGLVMEILPWTPLQHPLLPTSVAPWQQTQWCWKLGRTFYTFQTKSDWNLTQIQQWIWEEQLIEQKIQRFCYKYLLHTTSFHG